VICQTFLFLLNLKNQNIVLFLIESQKVSD